MKAVRLSADGEMTLRDLLALMRGAGGERLAALEALYDRRRVQDQLTMSLTSAAGGGAGERLVGRCGKAAELRRVEGMEASGENPRTLLLMFLLTHAGEGAGRGPDVPLPARLGIQKHSSKSSGQPPHVREVSALQMVMAGRKSVAQRKDPKSFVRELQ